MMSRWDKWAKHDIYPEVAHVPLLVRSPKLPKAGALTKGRV
jgi:arylsulfatase A-like enzyme